MIFSKWFEISLWCSISVKGVFKQKRNVCWIYNKVLNRFFVGLKIEDLRESVRKLLRTRSLSFSFSFCCCCCLKLSWRIVAISLDDWLGEFSDGRLKVLLNSIDEMKAQKNKKNRVCFRLNTIKEKNSVLMGVSLLFEHSLLFLSTCSLFEIPSNSVYPILCTHLFLEFCCFVVIWFIWLGSVGLCSQRWACGESEIVVRWGQQFCEKWHFVVFSLMFIFVSNRLELEWVFFASRLLSVP